MIPGDLIAGRYSILSKAGVGGMGVVYRAHDRLTHRDVALKIPWVGSHEENVALLREGELLARIKHSGVVAYIDHGMNDERQAYLVTEWIDGEDLKQRQAREPLTFRGC
ncbi:MAG: protein kinase [Polyangiaceae bacterium]